MTNLVPLKEIFHIKYGNQFDLNKMEIDKSGINFISRSSRNLGLVTKVERLNEVEPFEQGLITVTLGGTYLLSSFIQPKPFYTAQNIKVLKPKISMSFLEKIFYCKAIESNRYRYSSHGREANSTFDNILVPKEVPNYINKLNIDFYLEPNLNQSLLDEKFDLDYNNWKHFKLVELFSITGTKTTSLLELEEYGKGDMPYVTTQATNNGVEGFYDLSTEDGNVLTIDSAILGYCSYQKFDFSASDHVEKLIPKFEMTQYAALFLVTIINLEQYRYNYGRKCSQTRMKEISIKLPSKDNKPDFEFMEKYIKSLPYSKRL